MINLQKLFHITWLWNLLKLIIFIVINSIKIKNMRKNIKTNWILTAATVAVMQLTSVAQNKIIYASQPFSTNPTEQKEFKANSPIYGRVVLDKPLKEYCKLASKHLDNVPSNFARLIGLAPENQYDEEGNEKYDKTLVITYDLYLTFADLEKNYIDFDVMPTVADATSEYSSGLAFYRSFADQETETGKKSHFGIRLFPEYNESNAQIVGLTATGDFYIDYTASNYETVEQWANQCRKAQEAAKENALKSAGKNAAEQAKKLPLPVCFTRGQNKGYTDPKFSNAKITAMIKQMFGVTEVYNLTFDKPDGVNDFRSLVDASTNLPTYKMGNHVFYFAFKDKDGTYRFSGGVLKMDYEGYGKYGEAYIYAYSPIQGDEKFPIDEQRKQNGLYSVFVFDGTKLPK